MQVSVSRVRTESFGRRTLVVADVTLGGAYPEGGVALTENDHGLQDVDFAAFEMAPTFPGRLLQFNRATGSVQVFVVGTGLFEELADGVIVSPAKTVRAVFVGV